MKLSEVAKILNTPIHGEDKEITHVNTLKEAKSNELSFLSNPKYIQQLSNTQAGAIIVKEEFIPKINLEFSTALISETPYEDFARCIALFAKTQGFYQGISPQAYIHESAKIGNNCIIYPFVTIGENVTIGDNCTLFSSVYIGENSSLGNNCTLYPNAVVMAFCTLGNNCCLQPGAVIGSEGFGFVPSPVGIQKIPQIGKVELADKVEIGANSCVDRAALATTKIGKGTALDNLVQVGHNCEIGENCLIISQVGISGSTQIGDNVTIAGQTGVAGHIKIGSKSTIGPKSGITKDVPENSIMGGIPLTNYKNYMRTLALMPRFPELFKRLNRIEKELNLNEEND